MVPLLIFALLIGVPIIEIGLFIQVGDLIGLWATLATVVLTAIAGTALLRRQGLSVLNRLRATLERDELPVTELFDGVCLLVAGVALLTPGFMTDAVGFLLFLPPVRAAIALALLHRISVRMQNHRQPGPRPTGERGTVIDGDYKDLTNGGPSNGNSGGRLT